MSPCFADATVTGIPRESWPPPPRPPLALAVPRASGVFDCPCSTRTYAASTTMSTSINGHQRLTRRRNSGVTNQRRGMRRAPCLKQGSCLLPLRDALVILAHREGENDRGGGEEYQERLRDFRGAGALHQDRA